MLSLGFCICCLLNNSTRMYWRSLYPDFLSRPVQSFFCLAAMSDNDLPLHKYFPADARTQLLSGGLLFDDGIRRSCLYLYAKLLFVCVCHRNRHQHCTADSAAYTDAAPSSRLSACVLCYRWCLRICICLHHKYSFPRKSSFFSESCFFRLLDGRRLFIPTNLLAFVPAHP